MTPRKSILVCLFTSAALSSWAVDPKFPVSDIPEELKKGANMVYREDQMTISILSRSSALQRTYVVITILNPKAKKAATQYVAYSKLLKVNSISGAVYDAEGKLVKKLKNSDISDQSATNSSLFSDDRVKIADLSHTSYPYTIEFEAELEYKFLFYFPAWRVIPGENIAVQHSRLTVAFVEGAMPRFKIYNSDKKELKGLQSDGKQSWIWTFENLPAIDSEPFGPPLNELTPIIKVAPGIFQYESYSGFMNDWKNFGDWILSVNRGRDVLPEETRKKISELIKDIATPEEKAKVLYQYLQDKTRYVSIQIGIGGQQPFEASLVDQTGYGDCKALSNYMVTLLKEAGVKANYVLIKAGYDNEDIDINFPSTQFNHAIAAVPLEKDTLWLECTSQTNPFGYSGRFTGDRHALMITDQGGKIVRTPRYSQEANREDRTATVTITKDGNALAKVKTVYSGLQYENDHLDDYIHQSKEEQKKWIQENTDIPSFEVTSFGFSENREKIPEATLTLDLTIRSFASVSGKRLFVNPNLMNRNTYVPRKVENRRTPVVKSMAYTDSDVVELIFPEDLYPEFVPTAIHHESQFGVYDASFVLQSGKLTYTRKLKMAKGRFAPETYQELIDFYKNINKADNIKLVFLNKT